MPRQSTYTHFHAPQPSATRTGAMHGPCNKASASCMLDAALGYAAKGWTVFPAPVGTKKSHKAAEHSNGERWGQTKNPITIRRDFAKWEDANIGLPTGPDNGFFVIEADTPEGHDVDGIASIAGLEAQYGEKLLTLASISPSGSVHRYFNYPVGIEIKNSVSKIAPGVDVRGNGGMVIAPPSVKPGVGEYRWLNKYPIVDAPAWLLDLIAKAALKPDRPERTERAERVDRPERADHVADGSDRDPVDVDTIQAALDVIDSNCSHQIWMEVGAGLNHALGDAGFDLFDPWSSTSPQYNADACYAKWHGTGGLHTMTDYTVGSVLFYADLASPSWRQEHQEKTLRGVFAMMAEAHSSKPSSDVEPEPEQLDDNADHGSDRESDPNASSGNSDARAKPLISATSFTLRDPKLIPQRNVLYGKHLIRKFGSATIAAGGVGKTKLIIAEALAMVTGRPLLGIRPEERSKVWVWNGEDPLEEIERSVAAACIHFRITPMEIEGGLFMDSGRDSEIVIAHQTRDGAKVAAPMVEALLRTIFDNKIDVVMIDPFISSHRVTENDNNSIDIVAKTWTKIADITNTAIDLVHHSRKTGGAEVTVEDGRGAVALLNAVRSARSLNVMSPDEFKSSGVEGHRRSYFKVEDGKANLFPPSEAAEWYHLQSVELGNGPPNLPQGKGGDKIGVVTPWKWPDHLAGISGDDFIKVASVIRGGSWKASVQAVAWVGHAVAKALGLNVGRDKAKITVLLKVWLDAGTLVKVERMDEGARRLKVFVEVADDD
jgi:hypothetical protein